MLRSHLVTAAVVLASAAGAQSVYVPDNNPTAGTCNLIPFGHNVKSATWSNQKYQCMVTTGDIGSATKIANICDLGFAPCATGIRHFDTVEIVMGQTKATSLSTTYSTNLVTNVKTVLNAKNWDWHNDAAGAWTRIGLDTDYFYTQANGNLVIQITVTGAVLNTSSKVFPGCRQGNRQRIYSVGWSGTPPTLGSTGATGAIKIELVVADSDLNDFGLGCKGSAGIPDLHLSGSAKLGTGTVTIDVKNLPSSGALLHAFGLTRVEPGLDLAFAGAPGCKLYLRPDIILGAAATSSGTYRLAIKMPNDPKIVSVRVFTQVFTRGLTSSNFGRILPGR